MVSSTISSVGQWVEETLVSAASPSSSDSSEDAADTPWALYRSCLSLLSSLVPYVALYPTSEADALLARFTDDVGCLYLWGEGLNHEELVNVLAESEDLRNAILEVLTSFGYTLTDRLFSILATSTRIEDNMSVLQQIVDIKKRTHDARRIMYETPVLIKEGLDAPDDHEDVADPDVDDIATSIEGVLEQINDYIQCLMNLLPSLERLSRHIKSVQPAHHGVPPSTFKVSRPAGTYVRIICDRFASADSQLTQRLGEANWQRHQRIRLLANNSDDSQSIKVEETPISIFKPITEFRDSALGSSVRAQSSYAATIVSHTSFASTTSEKESGFLRVPPTPTEAFEGKSFDCTICRKRLYHVRTRIDWKLHVFEDLQPYICTFSDCEDSLVTFPSRKLWSEHEFTKHRVKKSWTCLQCLERLETPDEWKTHSASVHGVHFSDSQYQYALKMAQEHIPQQVDSLQCPLCLAFPGRSKRNFISHVGKHMESISLAALPREEDSETDSESSLSKNSTDHNHTKVGQDKTGSWSPEISSLIDSEKAPVPQISQYQLPFHCDLCDFVAGTIYQLRQHLLLSHDDHPFLCTNCGKNFNFREDQVRHEEALHSDDKTYVCKGNLKQGGMWGCGRRFWEADFFRLHFRSLEGRMCTKPLWDEEALEAGLFEQNVLGQLATTNIFHGIPAYKIPAAVIRQYPELAPRDSSWSSRFIQESVEGRLEGDSSMFPSPSRYLAMKLSGEPLLEEVIFHGDEESMKRPLHPEINQQRSSQVNFMPGLDLDGLPLPPHVPQEKPEPTGNAQDGDEDKVNGDWYDPDDFDIYWNPLHRSKNNEGYDYWGDPEKGGNARDAWKDSRNKEGDDFWDNR